MNLCLHMTVVLYSKWEDFMLPCLNKQLFGIECPGCGLQRSALLLLQGEFLAAFKMYPAIYPLIAFLSFVGLSIFINIKNSIQIKMVLAVITISTIVINYILKFIH